MPKTLPRTVCWGLALAIGVLVAAWRPALAQTMGRVEQVRGQVPAQVQVLQHVPAGASDHRAAALNSGGHTNHCPPHVAATSAEHHRGPSWHRGTGRRSQRDPSALLLASNRAGSIPAVDLFYLQRPTWHLVPRPPVHGTGQLAAPPRAPPR